MDEESDNMGLVPYKFEPESPVDGISSRQCSVTKTTGTRAACTTVLLPINKTERPTLIWEKCFKTLLL